MNERRKQRQMKPPINQMTQRKTYPPSDIRSGLESENISQQKITTKTNDITRCVSNTNPQPSKQQQVHTIMDRGCNNTNRGKSNKLAPKQQGFHYGMREVQQI
jgi:hypothetical protein